jgi:hypothetical protein
MFKDKIFIFLNEGLDKQVCLFEFKFLFYFAYIYRFNQKKIEKIAWHKNFFY